MSTPTPTPTDHDPDRGRFSDLRQSGGYRGTTLMLSLLVLVMLIVGAVFTAISARHDDAGDDPTSAGGVGERSDNWRSTTRGSITSCVDVARQRIWRAQHRQSGASSRYANKSARAGAPAERYAAEELRRSYRLGATTRWPDVATGVRRDDTVLDVGWSHRDWR